MSNQKELGLRVAEHLAQQAYGRYGSHLPVPIDPVELVDRAYPVVQAQYQKRLKPIVRKILIGAGIAVASAGVFCLATYLLAKEFMSHHPTEEDIYYGDPEEEIEYERVEC